MLHALKLTGLLNPMTVEERLQTAIQNCFLCNNDEEQSSYGMWFTPSLLSHSCIPNAAAVFDNTGTFSVVAQRAIQAGEEITISYISEEDLSCKTAHRRSVLAKSRRFLCQCPRCSGDDMIQPATCFVCGQILMYVDTGETMRKKSFCKRLASKVFIKTYVWSHVFFCALSGGQSLG